MGTGASEVSAGELTTTDSTASRTIVLSTRAEEYLSQLAVDLELGVVGTWQLSPALAQLYWFAYFAGTRRASTELARLSFECDRLYMFAFNPPTPPSPSAITFEELEQRRDAIYHQEVAHE